MSASQFKRSFKVGPHLVTLSIPLPPGSGNLKVDWNPLPNRLSKKRMREYCEKRNACLNAFANAHGVRLMIVTPDVASAYSINPIE